MNELKKTSKRLKMSLQGRIQHQVSPKMVKGAPFDIQEEAWKSFGHKKNTSPT